MLGLWRRRNRFQLTQETTGFGHTQCHDGIGTVLRVRHRVDAKFVRIAGGAEVSDILIIETEADAVNIIDAFEGAETKGWAKDTSEAVANGFGFGGRGRRRVKPAPVLGPEDYPPAREGNLFDPRIRRGERLEDPQAGGAGEILE